MTETHAQAVERLKKNTKPYGLLSEDDRKFLLEIGPTNLQIFSYNESLTYRIRPDYQPEPPKPSVVGKKVIVYDRYHFALPLEGWIESVAEKDGAYQIEFFSGQHGYPNYMKMNHGYFFSQQCRIIGDAIVGRPESPKPEYKNYEIFVDDNRLVFRDGDNGSYIPFYCAVGRPDFRGFFYDDEDRQVEIPPQYVARRMAEGKNVVARFERDNP